jgi:hypothetical protein
MPGIFAPMRHLSNRLWECYKSPAKSSYTFEVCWIAGSSRTGKLTELAEAFLMGILVEAQRLLNVAGLNRHLWPQNDGLEMSPALRRFEQATDWAIFIGPDDNPGIGAKMQIPKQVA